MEAASIPRARSRFRRPSWKAPLVFALYGLALFVAWSLVTGAIADRAPAAPATPAKTRTVGPPAPSAGDLALRAVANRAERSVVSVGKSAGFVAWTANGLSLIVTAKPASGWNTGADRSVEVTGAGGYESLGTLVRTDAKTGLGLVRVKGVVARPLWQTRRPAGVEAGDHLIVTGRGGSSIFAASTARYAAIWGASAEARPGAPVLNESGEVAGVVGSANRVIPIGRACGVIRHC